MSERMWMVRAGEGAYLIEEFKEKNIVAVGWKALGDETTRAKTREDFNQIIRKYYPSYRSGQIGIQASQIYKFVREFKIADYVLSYNPTERRYLIGKIQSEHKYSGTICEDYCNYREVEWIGSVNRDDMTTTTKYSLGAISTLFEVKDTAKIEILGLMEGKKEVVEEAAEEGLENIRDDIVDKSHEFIKDKIMKLDWDEMQELVAGILRAMGFKTRVSSKGPDRGKDIIASPDGLGLEEPKIVVEVKHRTESMGREKISSFLGGLRVGSKGLYVSTGGFSKEAKYEAERANIPITLIDIDELVKLIIQYYDDFDNEAKTLMPLTKIYWPISE